MAKLEIEIGANNKQLKDALKDVETALGKTGVAVDKLDAKTTKHFKKVTEDSRLYKQLSARLTEMRKNAQDVGAQFGVNSFQFEKASKAVQNLDARLKGIDGALGSYTRNVGNYKDALSSSNPVAMEFNRIIQDAPFGIQGVGNNIQQLTANFAQYAQSVKASYAEQGKTISGFGILKGAIGGMLSPLNLLTLGVSLATAGWTLYEKWSQKANKAEEEKAKALKNSKKGLDEYVSTLSTAQQIQVNGARNAQQELTNLRILFDVYRNGNNTLEQRKKAYDQLRQLAPEKFLKFESDATKILDSDYKELTKSILESAKARAGAAVISEKMQRSFVNSFKIEELTLTYEQLRAEEEILKKKREAFRLNKGTREMSGAEAQLKKQENALYEKQVELATQLKNIRTDDRKIAEQVRSITEQINTSMNNGGSLVDVQGSTTSGGTTSGGTTIATSPAQPLLDLADVSGLDGIDKQLKEVENRFDNFFKKQEARAEKNKNNRKLLAEISTENEKAQVAKQVIIDNLKAKEAQRVAEIIQKSNERTFIAEIEGREQALEKSRLSYEAELKMVQGNQDAITAIQANALADRDRINKEWDDKQAQDVEKRRQLEIGYFDEINKLATDNFTQNDNLSKRGRERIEKELKDRLDKIKDFFIKLEELYKNDPAMQGVLKAMQLQVEGVLTTNATTAKSPRFDVDNGTAQAIQRFQTDFIGALQNITNQGEGLLLGLGKSFTSMFDDVFKNQLNQAFNDLVSGVKVDIKSIGGALTSMLGNLVSGLSKPTSAVGQGIGGALSGAGAGLMAGTALGLKTGNPIGAIIGAGIGLLSGIFSASKAKKQEELQKKQVALQEQQLAEQKRANALAYTSNIIGQMTRDGLVTAIERDAYGDLKVKIEGKDLVLAYDRTKSSQKR